MVFLSDMRRPLMPYGVRGRLTMLGDSGSGHLPGCDQGVT